MVNKDRGIDHLLEDVPLTIEASLKIAIDEGRMSEEEARDCATAYYQVFDGLEPPLELPKTW